MYKSLIALLVAMPLAAFAEGGKGGSEFFYQAEGGKQDVTGSLSVHSSSLEFKGTTGATEVNTTELEVEYEYGLMSELSVGARLGYVVSGDYETAGSTTKGDISGLRDLELLAKANMPAGPGTLRYGADLVLDLQDGEVETNGDQNAATKGMELNPYVGYEYPMGNCTLGAKLAVEVGLADATTESGNTKTDYSGGEDTTFSVFYEHEFSGDMRLGAALDWVTTSDTTDETNGGDTENLSPTQVLSVYLPTKLGNGTLLPKFQYYMTSADKVDTAKVDSYSATNLEVGYRVAF